MSDPLTSSTGLGQVVKLLVSEVFLGSYYLAAAILVLMFYGLGMLRRRYTFRDIAPKLKSASVTTAFYAVNFVAFMPIVVLLHESINETYESLQIPRLSAELWQDVPLAFMIVLILLAIDFVNYAGHRLLHLPWLWPSHAIHHSDSNMTGLTNYRIHFLEVFLMGIAHIVLLSWLNLPGNILPYGAIFATLYGVYIHMEMDWGHGPLRLVLASPRFHQWHHADTPKAYGKNLAGMFPIYDVIFGTYYVPGKCTARLGARGVPEHNLAAMIVHPFKEWSRMLLRLVNRRSRVG